ncbi:MAG: DUF262 domain-containing protein [Fluviicoccus sp.]|uniref:DUF262 domain-containing protein n=1 Tax=Fluviicoccus sp. TaxID=2003552 RepID=UPI0027207A1A|nr:DUF262 domain-containing protein [Fluviicoccus sp.]MDO8329644.1 DUF262 domain-containing protein [Fluviicoccus sp.]
MNKPLITVEHIDNESTELEIEDDHDSNIREPEPYDPEEIRVDTNQFSLRNILDMIDDEELDLAPDFQRFKVWSDSQKSRLIESVLLRIPLPAFYFSSDNKGFMQVVDGVQRLSTLHEFVRSPSSFPLTQLEYLSNKLDGMKYNDLPDEWVWRINRTQLTVNVIDPQTPTPVKFDIFKRLNTGGSPLTAQEIRHCMSRTPSRQLLKSIVESAEFSSSLPQPIVKHKRMANRELALRALGFMILDKDINIENKYTSKKYRDYDSLDDFLNDITHIIDTKLNEKQINELKNRVLRGIDNAYRLFGKRAFRKWPQNEEYLYPVNKSVFDALVVCLGNYQWTDIMQHKKFIISAYREQCSTSEFDASVSRGTAKPASVEYRFKTLRKILEEI